MNTSMTSPYCEQITKFMVSCVPDCENELLTFAGTIIATTWETWQEAISRLIRSGMKDGRTDYSIWYSAWHYGDNDYLWEFERYAVYEPIKGDDQTLVVLYYRPVGCKTLHMLYSKKRTSQRLDDNGGLPSEDTD